MSAIFVTATGTDIGKTFVTSGLIRHLRATGQTVDALKPVMSGYDPSAAETSDAGVLLRALGRPAGDTDVSRISRWRYRAPLAPDLAAAREGKRFDADALIADSRDAVARADGTLLIEGVGGIMVPLDETRTVLDWMVALDIPVMLVAGNYLGTISHTLTALEVLASSRLDVRALVVSDRGDGDVALPDTIETLHRFGNRNGKHIDIVAVPERADAQHPAFAEIAALLGL